MSPLDGSDLAEQAIPLTAEIAGKIDAEVILTTAITTPDRWVDDGAVRRWEAEQQAGVELARERGAGLVVVTTHGRSGLDRWVFGSVADAVVRRGELPVMVIRSWATIPEEQPEPDAVTGNSVVPR